MKRQIRKGVFETNSSSTHSIAIPKNSSRTLRYVEFCTNDFGWEFNQVSPDDYFYTAIYETSDTECEVNTKIEKLKNILNEHDITYDFAELKTHTWHSDSSNKDYFSLDDGYIDHGYELKEFVDELLNDGDKLVRFLSGGLVFTGNDNSEMDYVNRTERLIEDYDWETHTSSYHENPYYMDNHEDYEWYYKGN